LRKNCSRASSGDSRKWVKYERNRVKINKAMKDIGPPKFGMHDNFIELHDIAKLHTEKYSSWVEGITKMIDTREPS
jgi:hypothetical protein